MRVAGLFLALASFVVIASTSAVAQQKEDPIYKAGDGVTAPRLIKEVPARYPPDAMRRRIQGRVQLECVVSREGEPTDIRVIKSLDESLDEASVEAMQQWRFEPGTKDGQPVRVRITVDMTFTVRK